MTRLLFRRGYNGKQEVVESLHQTSTYFFVCEGRKEGHTHTNTHMYIHRHMNTYAQDVGREAAGRINALLFRHKEPATSDSEEFNLGVVSCFRDAGSSLKLHLHDTQIMRS